MHKEIKEIVKRLEANGYSVTHGGKHLKVKNRAGAEALLDPTRLPYSLGGRAPDHLADAHARRPRLAGAAGRRALRAGEALRLDREAAGEELLLEGGELGGA